MKPSCWKLLLKQNPKTTTTQHVFEKSMSALQVWNHNFWKTGFSFFSMRIKALYQEGVSLISPYGLSTLIKCSPSPSAGSYQTTLFSCSFPALTAWTNGFKRISPGRRLEKQVAKTGVFPSLRTEFCLAGGLHWWQRQGPNVGKCDLSRGGWWSRDRKGGLLC